jgi:hypothetical protein
MDKPKIREEEVRLDRHVDRCEQCEAAYPDPNGFCEVGQGLYNDLAEAVYAADRQRAR